MKSKIAALFIIALIVTIADPLRAHAYTFNDALGDKIGGRDFELYGMNVTQTADQVVFDIFSNYKENGYKVGSWDTKPGDFALDLDGDSIFEYGIAFTTHNSVVKGGMYQINTSLNTTDHIANGWYVSNHYAPGGYSYNKNKIVQIADGQWFEDINITWNSNGLSPDWRVNFAIDKDSLSLMHGDTFNFFYSVATCSNDNMAGSVNVTPEPTSMALLGFGLFGLAGLGRRRK